MFTTKIKAGALMVCLTCLFAAASVPAVSLAAADKTALTALVGENTAKTADIYSASTFAAFDTARTNATAVLANDQATQTEIQGAYDALYTAVDGLLNSINTNVAVDRDLAVRQNNGDGDTSKNPTLSTKNAIDDTTTSTTRRTYLAFKLADISPNSTKVTLTPYVLTMSTNNGYTTVASVYGAATSWKEENTTFANRPAVTTGALSSVSSTWFNYDADVSKQVNVEKIGYYDFDVTDYVLGLKKSENPPEEVAFAFATGTAGTAMFTIASKENTTFNKPALLVAEGGTGKTLGQMKEDDLNSIDIASYINNPSADRITNDLNTLPDISEAYDYPITWKSDHAAIMSDSGKIVSRPTHDTTINMIATITADGTTHARQFPLTVLKDVSHMTDNQIIQEELDTIQFSDFSDQNQHQVISDIALPQYKYSDSCQYAWTSSDPSVVAIENYVASFTPKNNAESNVDLILTATYGTGSVTKKFPVTVIRGFADNIIIKSAASVKATSGNASQAVGRDFISFWESAATDAEPAITYSFKTEQTINAALFVEKGSNITAYKIQYSADGSTWNDAYTGTALGDRKRNPVDFASVTAKFFRFVVTAHTEESVSLYTTELYYGAITDRQCIEFDKSAITLPRSTITSLNLPTSGANGTTIQWESSASSVISNTGVISRPDNGTVSVVLTATFSKGAETEKVVYPSISVTAETTIHSGGGGSGGGGFYIPQTTPEPVPAATPEPGSQIPFADVTQSHWAYDYVKELLDRNVITSADTFRPDSNITREEFTKMLVIALKSQASEGELHFSDVDSNAWYYPYLAQAVELGITNGLGDGTFGVGKFITREDIAVMSYRVMEKSGKAGSGDRLPEYADKEKISDYTVNAVANLAVLGIMNGNTSNEFLPKNNATRAEAAKIICLIQEAIK